MKETHIQKMNTQPSDKLSSIKRFAIGILIGLFIAAISWLCSTYFHVNIPLIQGIIGSLLLSISFGILATFSGIDKLLNNLPEF
ncbi:hypothetical protein Riv7116_4836 [Rivularia sp. PCC 7116]|uniref:hypothetical protein n=1 Tax=Rivularia sp. PCC 7116 TaxID=373994 RepID=UPI00029F2E6B|nr:hypothetical protein [Rivularia sp. PCC 7116]AFY57247.1 hypothetical protein Riv7116_4836 [Rivularia sp. PCC 7116]